MKASHSELETEVKFHLPDPAGTRAAILELGAESQGRVFERNLCFDTPDARLEGGDRLLRLRRDRGVRLTYKAPPQAPPSGDGRGDPSQGEVKVYREIELELSSWTAMAAILAELGFREARRYEKWRETFVQEEAHLCLDEMPFGHFLEIEGPPATIRSLAAHLGLAWKERILADYLAIFEAVRHAATGVAVGPDPTFAACTGLRPSAEVWARLRAG